VTGISRLAYSGVLSSWNNMTDISFRTEYATILGYTWAEIEESFGGALPLLAKLHGLDPAGVRERITEWYDNFLFDAKSPSMHVFNPFSVNALFATGEFKAHWSLTAPPSLVLTTPVCVDVLARADVDPTTVDEVSLEGKNTYFDLFSPDAAGQDTDETRSRRVALGVHTGYLSLLPGPIEVGAEKAYRVRIPNVECAGATAIVLSNSAAGAPVYFAARVRAMVGAGDVRAVVHFFCETWLPFWLAWRRRGMSGVKNPLAATFSESPERQAAAPAPSGATSETDDWVERNAHSAFLVMLNGYVRGNVQSDVSVEGARTHARGGAPSADIVLRDARGRLHIVEVKLLRLGAEDAEARAKIRQAREQVQKYAVLDEAAALWVAVLRVRGARVVVEHVEGLARA